MEGEDGGETGCVGVGEWSVASEYIHIILFSPGFQLVYCQCLKSSRYSPAIVEEVLFFFRHGVLGIRGKTDRKKRILEDIAGYFLYSYLVKMASYYARTSERCGDAHPPKSHVFLEIDNFPLHRTSGKISAMGTNVHDQMSLVHRMN